MNIMISANLVMNKVKWYGSHTFVFYMVFIFAFLGACDKVAVTFTLTDCVSGSIGLRYKRYFHNVVMMFYFNYEIK